MNFFNTGCQEPPITDKTFGICDDDNGGKAYTNKTDRETWIATVKNDNQKTIIFTAIDKCIIKDSEEPGRGRCDGMLTFSDYLYFVELKSEPKGWISDAIVQLESTIRFFRESHKTHSFRHKKAFICNKKHPHFHEINNEINLQFYRLYGFRLDVQAAIIVI